MLKIALIRLAKGSLIYGIGGMVQRFMSLLLLPFFTRVLTPEDYGVVALISLIGVVLSGLFTLGTGNSMGVLYFREQNLLKRPTIIWSTTMLMIANGAFWYIVVFLSASTLSTLMFQSDRYADLIRLALLGSAFSTIADPWLAYLRMEEKAKSYIYITLISSMLSIALSIWLVLVQQIGVTGVILAATLVQGIMLLVSGLLIGYKLPFNVDVSLFRPLVRIGFPSIFGLFAFMLIDYADRQMIERMVGINALGIYSVGYSFGMLIAIAVGAFATAWPPFFMSYLNRPEEARTVFAHVLTYYLIGFGSLLVLFFFIAQPMVILMTASTFHNAINIVGLVAAAYMLKGCYLIVLPGIYFAEKLHKQSAVELIAAIVNVGLNLWLIPIYGIVGAALATLISYLTLPVLAWLLARHYLAVNYEWRRIAGMVLLLTITCSLLFWLSTQININWLVILTSFIVVLFYLGIVYWHMLNPSEREKLRRLHL